MTGNSERGQGCSGRGNVGTETQPPAVGWWSRGFSGRLRGADVTRLKAGQLNLDAL